MVRGRVFRSAVNRPKQWLATRWTVDKWVLSETPFSSGHKCQRFAARVTGSVLHLLDVRERDSHSCWIIVSQESFGQESQGQFTQLFSAQVFFSDHTLALFCTHPKHKRGIQGINHLTGRKIIPSMHTATAHCSCQIIPTQYADQERVAGPLPGGGSSEYAHYPVFSRINMQVDSTTLFFKSFLSL